MIQTLEAETLGKGVMGPQKYGLRNGYMALYMMVNGLVNGRKKLCLWGNPSHILR